MDLSAMREALADGKVWSALGIVTAVEGAHYRLDEDDVVVDVLTIPDEELVTCRLGAGFGGFGIGLWSIPPEGAEVAILVPLGEYNFSPVIVAVLSSGALPDGVAANVTIIANASVLVHDGNGGAEPLITKSQYDAHKHPTGVGPSGVPDNIATSGTTVLKAK